MQKSDLVNLMEKGELCEIYTDPDRLDIFSVGYIVSVDEDFFILESINEYGKFDGYYCEIIDNIIKIEIKTQYLNDIIKLLKYNKQNRPNKMKFSSNILNNFLDKIMQEHRICTISLLDGQDGTIGFIEKMKDNILTIKNIDNHGKEDGFSFIDTRDISIVEMGSSDFEKIEILNKLS